MDGNYGRNWKDKPGGKKSTDAPGIPSGAQLQVGQSQPDQIRMRTGIVWVMENQKLVPHKIKSGLSDGNYAQVEGALKDGDMIITGVVNTTQQAGAPQQQSPFMPQMGRPAAGRGGR
jgi:hypothetical protein